jgi:hypothetical protein
LLRTEPAGSRWVVEALCAAGDRALARGAPVEAVALLGRALEEPAADRQGTGCLLRPFAAPRYPAR